MVRSEDFAEGQKPQGLSDTHKAILDFAGKTYNHPGKQHEDMLEQFGYGPTTFHQKLSTLLSDPDAMEYAPGTVKRYQRVVDQGLIKWGHRPRYSL